jgi:peptidoglycan lytic transglycosylase
MINISKILTYLTLLLILIYGSVGCTPAPVFTSGRSTITKSSHKNSINKEVQEFRKGQILEGEASYYGPKFHGRLTANGETYDQNGISCAHKTLPFNTILRVTLLSNGKSIDVRVNDRGPYKKGRIIDLSLGAAKRIGMVEQGTGSVRAQIIKLGSE